MRLDVYLQEKGFFESRTKAQQAIERGEIFINDEMVKKSSIEINDCVEHDIRHVCQEKFVSLGGYKLNKAIKDFKFNCENLIVADVGASTGGFTDCLLKQNAKKVYAVDLNDTLLHASLKNNDKVKMIVKNARNLTRLDFDEDLDLIVADLSFISVTYVLDTFSKLLKSGKHLIILIKPQFELNEKVKLKNGIVKDKKMQLKICKKVFDYAKEVGLTPINFTNAPINEEKNLEFLMLLEKNCKDSAKKEIVEFIKF